MLELRRLARQINIDSVEKINVFRVTGNESALYCIVILLEDAMDGAKS